MTLMDNGPLIVVHKKEWAMAAKHNALSAQKVKTLTKPVTYADGNGLTLRGDANGKRWVQRLTIGGRARNLGLG